MIDSLVVSGSPYERGYQWGEAFRDAIDAHRPSNRPPEDWPMHKHGDASARQIFYTLAHAPELLEEIRGMGDGARIGFEQSLMLTNGAALSYAHGEWDGCSNFAAITVDAGPVLGKTEDPGGGSGSAAAQPNWKYTYAMKKARPSAGYRYITFPRKHNMWLSAGMNEVGLAVGQSSGPYPRGNQDGAGINYLAMPQILFERCRTATEAVELLDSLVMAGKGCIFMIVDAHGTIRAVEKWHNRQAVRTPENGVLFFANRFEAPSMQDFPARYDAEHAKSRFNNFKSEFGKGLSNGGITWEFMEKMLRFHAPAGSICRHGTDSPADAGALTSPGFLFDCARRRLAFYFGVPCQVDPQWVEFDF